MQILNFVVDLKDSDKLSSFLTLKGKFYTLAIANNPLMILVEILLWQDQNKNMAHTPQRRRQSFEKYFSKVCHPGSWIWRPYFRFWFLFLLCRSPKMRENVEILERQNIASGGFTGWFLGPRGPLVLPLVGPCAVCLQEFLLLLLLLLLHTRSQSPLSPWWPPRPCHPW